MAETWRKESEQASFVAIHSPGVGDWEFPQGSEKILRMVKEMVETGIPQGPLDEMIEAVAIADAAERALETGEAHEPDGAWRRSAVS